MLNPKEQGYLTIQEVADLVGRSPGTVYHWIVRGIEGRCLPAVKIRGITYVAQADLEAISRPVQVPTTRPQRSASKRRRASERAVKELERMGA